MREEQRRQPGCPARELRREPLGRDTSWLIEAGASPEGNPDGALVNGNIAAAERLVGRGLRVTLATALCLGRWDDVSRLAGSASARDRQFGLVLAALRGNGEALAAVIRIGVDLDAPSADLYAHATALHHAVYSGSLEAVKVLVEAGAALDTRDTLFHGTPLGWAEYGKHEGIAAYLREKGGMRDGTAGRRHTENGRGRTVIAFRQRRVPT